MCGGASVLASRLRFFVSRRLLTAREDARPTTRPEPLTMPGLDGRRLAFLLRAGRSRNSRQDAGATTPER